MELGAVEQIKSFLKLIYKGIRNRHIPVVRPVVENSIVHQPPAFTQGLCFKDGLLYESSGLNGQSCLKKIDPVDGRILDLIRIEKEFTEGVGSLGDKLVQLTWKAETAYVYTRPGMEKIGEYGYQGHGWGLTETDNLFIMSNGSRFLNYYDADFVFLGSKAVKINEFPLKKINDLAFAEGYVFANVFYEDFIFKINENSGRVESLYDLGFLRKMSGTGKRESVLNGIAYDRDSGLFYITGKNWAKIYKVRLI